MPRANYSILSLVATYLLLIATASAHIVEQFYADYQQGSGVVVVNFDVAYAMPDIRDDPDSPQPKRTWLTSLTDAQHQALREEAERYIRSYIQFENDGKTLDYQITFPDFDQKPYPFIELINEGAYYTIQLIPDRSKMSAETLFITVTNGTFPDLHIARTIHDQITFETVEPSMRLGLDKFTISTSAVKENVTSAEKPSYSTLQLIILGFRHVIPDGLDHVLFIIGMCLMAGSVRQLLWQSLVFTAAHALSMALVISQVLPIYSYGISAYIEAMIALSIAFIAAEALLLNTALKWRFTLIGLFGFIHGLGFAGSLGSTLQFLSADNWIQPLIWANIGIEIAQAILVIICYSLLIYLKNQSDKLEKNLRVLTSLAIAGFGLLWFFQRLP